MNKWKLLLAVALSAFAAKGQAQTTSVSFQLTDSQGTQWQNAAYTATFVNAIPIIPPTVNNQPFTLTYAGTANSTGLATLTVADVAFVNPAGGTWKFCATAAVTTAQTYCVTVPATGASESITAQFAAVIQPPSQTGGPFATAYGDVEVAEQLGTEYFRVTDNTYRCFTGSWVPCNSGGGGGGGGTPGGPLSSIQFNNDGIFGGTTNSTYNPNTITVSWGDNVQDRSSLENVSRHQYDVMNTRFAGGWAAAYALSQTTGNANATTAVVQAALDDAHCDALVDGGDGDTGTIILPSNYGTLPINGLQVWDQTELTSASGETPAILQHFSHAQSLIQNHSGTDQITCANGITYVQGHNSNFVSIHGLGFFGAGPSAQSTPDYDIGVYIDGGGDWEVYDIGGWVQGFGSQFILDNGNLENKLWTIGKPGLQALGCLSYVGGYIPTTQIVGGFCATVQEDTTDGKVRDIYASNGIFGNTNVDPCTGNTQCAGLAMFGANVRASDIFIQLSGTAIYIGSQNQTLTDVRIDSTTASAVIVNGPGNDIINNVHINSPCSGNNYAAAYNANQPSGCNVFYTVSQTQNVLFDNIIIDQEAGAGLGSSYIQTWFQEANSGGSGIGNRYENIAYYPNANNLSNNNEEFLGPFDGSQEGAYVSFPTGSPSFPVDTPSLNAAGVTNAFVNTSSQIVNIFNGVFGQHLYLISGVAGASVANNYDIGTCSQLPEPLTNYAKEFINVNALGSNSWTEVCNTPNLSTAHVNYVGNYAPTNPSIVDVIGNIQPHPFVTTPVGSTLGGPAAPSGNYTFTEEYDFADGSEVTSPPVVITTKLSTLTAGGIFVTPSFPGAIAYKLWFIADTTGDGLPLGQIGPTYTATNGPGNYWNYTLFVAGGNGAAAPPANVNNTGTFLAESGLTLNTTVAQPACSVFQRYVLWIVPGNGTSTADNLQFCERTAAGTYAWSSAGSGGGSGSVTNFSAGTLAPLFTTSVAAATSTPNLTFALNAQSAYTVFGNFTNGTAAPTFTAGSGTGVPVLTTSATLTSPTFVTPALGTPASGVLTHGTGLPLTTGVTGVLPIANGGIGSATAAGYTVFGNFTGAAAAPTFAAATGTGNPVLSSNPSITLGNATGLPLTSGVTGLLPVANGGNGTASPGLVAGTNVTISGTWPTQTINATGSGGSSGISGQTAGYLPLAATPTTLTSPSSIDDSVTTASTLTAHEPFNAPQVSVVGTGAPTITATSGGAAAKLSIPNGLTIPNGTLSTDAAAFGQVPVVPASAIVLGSTSGSVLAAAATTGTGNVVLSASPTFTGVPVAPTASVGTNTTQLATTAFVLANASSGSGTINTGTANDPAYYAAGGTTLSPVTDEYVSNTNHTFGQSTSGLHTFDVVGQLGIIYTGPTTNPTVNAAATSAATAITVTSTTGLVIPGDYVFGPNSGYAELAHCSAAPSSTTLTCARGVYGTAAHALAVGDVIYSISDLKTESNNLPPTEIQIWHGPKFVGFNGLSSTVIAGALANGLPASGYEISQPTFIGGFTTTSAGTVAGLTITGQPTSTTSPFLLTGSPVNSAQGTMSYTCPTATAPTYYASGSVITINACSGFAGKMIDMYVNGVTAGTIGANSTGGNWQTAYMTATANMTAAQFGTKAVCNAVGTSATQSVASCTANSAAGHFSCKLAASGNTCLVNDTAVNTNSTITVELTEAPASLGVTCATIAQISAVPFAFIHTQTAGSSFVINMPTFTTATDACFEFHIIN